MRDGDTAIAEMAAASGLALLHGRLDVRRATTTETGELIRHAMDRGTTRIVLGIDGSATTDGGAGALAALGARFFDRDAALLAPNPLDLARLDRIDVAHLTTDWRSPQSRSLATSITRCSGRRVRPRSTVRKKGASAGDVAFLDASVESDRERIGRCLSIGAPCRTQAVSKRGRQARCDIIGRS
ncbi:MAG: glycerate kinase [Candidatus Velthaea sp.]|jgi:glycerate kinase